MAQTTLLEAKDRETLTMPGARLIVRAGADRGKAIHLTKEETVIGTGASADFRLSDTTVSRSHVLLRVTATGYLLEDLGSTNGTLLEGHRVLSAFVEVGDRISLGATQLRLEAQKQPVSLALSRTDGFGRLIGRSVAARRLFGLLEQTAREDATVLLMGETGSGKDAVAEAIHEASGRRNGPFVVVDCGAIVPTLVEAELFGHQKGAFTGAHATRIGAFEAASGGTLFLDEIGELPRDLQPKLLRVIEKREVRSIGSHHPRNVDVRIIAATNRDIRRDVNRGLFREDLFYRLNVISIRVPPLRERVADIPVFAQEFLREATHDPKATLSEDILASLVAYDWPGNIRELRNRIEQLAITDRAETTEDEPAAARAPSFHEAKAAMVENFERTFVTEALRRAGGNVSEAARQARMDRVYLTKLIRKHRTTDQ